MNPKLKRTLIVLSSSLVLFLAVFFMTRSITNLIDTPKTSITKSSNKNNEKNLAQGNEESQTQKSGNYNKISKNDKSDNKSTQNSQKYIDYVVKSGDTLSNVSQQFMSWSPTNTAIKTLIEMNNLKSSELLPVGSHLMIPKNPIDTTGCIKHIVSKGETLYKIANKYFPNKDANKEVKVIMDKNNISDPGVLTPNRTIYIPKDSSKISK